MCGRLFNEFRRNEIEKIIEEEYDINSNKFEDNKNINNYESNYNIKPNNFLLCLNKDRNLFLLNWGYENIKNNYLMINLKIENLRDRLFFNKSKNILLMVSGYYEWDKNKFPHSFKMNNKKLLILACVQIDLNVVILTQDSINFNQNIHDRMPIILYDKEDINNWLDGKREKIYDLISSKNYKEYLNNNLSIVKLTKKLNKSTDNNDKTILKSFEKFSKNEGLLKYFKKNENLKKTNI